MRHVLNFFITGGLIWIFQLIGWIAVQADIAPFASVIANQLLVAGIIGLIFTLGMWALNLVYILLVFASCGLAALLWPIKMLFIGPIGFYAVVQVLPGWINVTATPLQIIIMGLIISIIRIPAISASSSSSNNSNS